MIDLESAFPVDGSPTLGRNWNLEGHAPHGDVGLSQLGARVVDDHDDTAIGVLEGDRVAACGFNSYSFRVDEIREVTKHVIDRCDVQLLGRAIYRE